MAILNNTTLHAKRTQFRRRTTGLHLLAYREVAECEGVITALRMQMQDFGDELFAYRFSLTGIGQNCGYVSQLFIQKQEFGDEL